MRTYTDLLEAFEAYLFLRNYRPATHRSYLSSLRLFFRYRREQGWQGDFTEEQARAYLVARHRSEVSWTTVNIDYSAMKLLYEEVLKQPWDVAATPRPRSLKQLPRILSKEEVERVISSAKNLKAQAFMLLLYGTGLRMSEALAVKLVDINSERLQLRVSCGKGGKDRYVAMPEQLVPILRSYYKEYRPVEYLFNGDRKGTTWKMRSAQHAIQLAAQRAGVKKEVTAHVFRHCYATHHLESGTSLLFLKEQLGHKDLKTTQQYLHLCTLTQTRVHHPMAELEPLLAMHRLLQHVLPPYFQRSRHCGLHAGATYRKYRPLIPHLIKQNGQSIRTLFQILKLLIGVAPDQCPSCQSVDLVHADLPADPTYLQKHLRLPSRSPPQTAACA